MEICRCNGKGSSAPSREFPCVAVTVQNHGRKGTMTECFWVLFCFFTVVVCSCWLQDWSWFQICVRVRAAAVCGCHTERLASRNSSPCYFQGFSALFIDRLRSVVARCHGNSRRSERTGVYPSRNRDLSWVTACICIMNLELLHAGDFQQVLPPSWCLHGVWPSSFSSRRYVICITGCWNSSVSSVFKKGTTDTWQELLCLNWHRIISVHWGFSVYQQLI